VDDFWSSFPSSPIKPKSSKTNKSSPEQEGRGGQKEEGDRCEAAAALWPQLRTLNLSSNKLRSDSLPASFPRSLRVLDLSRNHLLQPITLSPACLADLVELDLAGNEFQCEIFKNEVELPALRRLGLESNALDVLTGVERVLVSDNVRYVGLPATVAGQKSREDEDEDEDDDSRAGKVEVRVSGNMLGGEAKRRRAAAAVAAAKMPPARNTLRHPSHQDDRNGREGSVTERASAQQQGRGEVEEAADSIANIDLGRPESPSSSSDPSLETLRSNFDRASGTLRLASKSLSTFPSPAAPVQEAPFEVVEADVSRNLLTVGPFAELAAWRFCTTLRVLDLSRNQLASLGNLFLDNDKCEVVFEALTELNLSSNRLANARLASLARMAPRLEVLDLTYNVLDTIEGVSELLVCSDEGVDEDDDSTEKGRRRRSEGLRILRLGGNRISDVDELVKIGERFQQNQVIKGWRCTELSISDNDLAQVRPPQCSLLNFYCVDV
jgi:Leucine-rich repeat (LRR) protein